MKTLLYVITAFAIAFAPVSAFCEDAPQDAPEEEAAPVPGGLGLTQGKFAIQIIHEVRAERFFEGTLTAALATEKLAEINLIPAGGWKIDKELTRDDLGSAYKRMISHGKAAREAGEAEGAEPEEKADAGDPDEDDPANMTIVELIEKITEAVRKAFAQIELERAPISPTGAAWTY